MEYKAYYDLKFKAEKEPKQIFFDYVNCDDFICDVQDADFGGDYNKGEEKDIYHIYGSFSFFVTDVDGDEMDLPKDPDFSNCEAVFVMLDDDGEQLEIQGVDFSVEIYIDGKKKEFSGYLYED